MNKKLKWWLPGSLLLGVLLYFIFDHFIVLFIPLILSSLIESFREQRKYRTDLHSIEGTRFFCYNSRVNNKDFIEAYILRELSPDIQVIYLDGRIPLSGHDIQLISRILRDISDKRGFPYLLKIKNRRVINVSINDEFYNIMSQGRETAKLMTKINSFYQT